MYLSRNFSAIFFFFLAAMLVSLGCQFITQFTGGSSEDTSPHDKQIESTPGNGINHKLSLLGQTGGSSYAIVQGNFAYLGVDPRVYVLDTSDSSMPKVIGQSGVMPGMVRSVIASGNYVYVAAGKGSLRVLDVSDPTQPTKVASLVEYSYAQVLTLDGTTLYIADNDGGLVILNYEE